MWPEGTKRVVGVLRTPQNIERTRYVGTIRRRDNYGPRYRNVSRLIGRNCEVVLFHVERIGIRRGIERPVAEERISQGLQRIERDAKKRRRAERDRASVR